MTQMLTTQAVSPHDRLAYWTDLLCNVYVQLDCDAPRDDRFDGTIRRDRVASLDLSVVDSGPQRVMRTPRQIAKASEDYFLVSIQTAGTGRVRQDGREAALRPGDFALYDSTRPYELEFAEPFQQLVLMLPGEQLRSLVRDTQRLTATAVCGRQGAGQLLIGMLDTLRKDVDRLQPASAAAVADGVVNILVAGLRTLPAANQPGLSDLAAYHLERIKAYVRDNLRDPELSIGTLSRALQLSPGHIHRLFQREPLPLGHTIWAQRLEACRCELGDPQQGHRSITEIAFGWGFNGAAHFSRAFKERFGVSPREWRASKSSTGRA
jgi:AraC-like DNA-binding protein